jgi:hypothetical protein
MMAGAIFPGSARALACRRRSLAFANFFPVLPLPEEVLGYGETFVAGEAPQPAREGACAPQIGTMTRLLGP